MTTTKKTAKLTDATRKYLEDKGIEITDVNGGFYVIVDCFKCSGTGHIEAFSHYAQGVCFQCAGAKRSVRTAANVARSLKATERRNRKATEAHEARLEGQRERNGGWTDAEVSGFDEDAVKASKAARKARLRHVGQVGESLTEAVTVTACFAINGAYGPTNLVRAEDADGNALVCFTQKSFDTGAKILGRVKDHGDYDGAPQTKLSHPKKA